MKPRIYVASRASVQDRPAMWRSLRDAGWNIISTWIDEAGPGETASMSDLWERIDREVASCDVLVLYAEPSDLPLKGAFVEVGMALAYGKPVIVVGADLGSWTHHPMVMRVPEIHDVELGISVLLNWKDDK